MAKCITCKEDKPFTVLSRSYPQCAECHDLTMKNPKAGDIVKVLSSDDCLITTKGYGVICGRVGKETPFRDDEKTLIEICFNPSPLPWWDGGFVDSSGGPVLWLKSAQLKPTTETKKQLFQNWKRIDHGRIPIMGAGQAKERFHTVQVWTLEHIA